jgi:hypothetical protein
MHAEFPRGIRKEVSHSCVSKSILSQRECGRKRAPPYSPPVVDKMVTGIGISVGKRAA